MATLEQVQEQIEALTQKLEIQKVDKQEVQ